MSLLPEYGRRFKLRDYAQWTASDDDDRCGDDRGDDRGDDGGGHGGIGETGGGGGGRAPGGLTGVPATAWDQAVALDKERRLEREAAVAALSLKAALPPTFCAISFP
jgi:hypothetical protein